MKCKRILCLCLLMAFCTCARAQVLIALLFGKQLNTGKASFGLTGGVNVSSFTGIDAEYNPTFCLGIYFSYKLTDKISLEPRFYPKFTGGARGMTIPLPLKYLNFSWDQRDVTRRVTYLMLPLMIGYNFTNRWLLSAGPQVGMQVGIRDDYHSDEKRDKLSLKVDDVIHRFDLGVTGALRYRLGKTIKSASLAFQYYYGLTNASTEDAVKPIHNSVFQFLVGIPIGVGSAEPNEPASGEL